MEQLYSVKSASEKTAMSVGFFRKAIENKEIDTMKIGKSIRFTEEALEKFMVSKGYKL